MKNSILCLVIIALLFNGCSGRQQDPKDGSNTGNGYLDFSDRDDQFTGGIKMIPISTPKGEFKVWTKRVGNNPDKKVLLLHGGPGGTHKGFYKHFPVQAAGKSGEKKGQSDTHGGGIGG